MIYRLVGYFHSLFGMNCVHPWDWYLILRANKRGKIWGVFFGKEQITCEFFWISSLFLTAACFGHSGIQEVKSIFNASYYRIEIFMFQMINCNLHEKHVSFCNYFY